MISNQYAAVRKSHSRRCMGSTSRGHVRCHHGGAGAEYQVRTKTGSTNVFYEIVPLAFSEVG